MNKKFALDDIHLRDIPWYVYLGYCLGIAGTIAYMSARQLWWAGLAGALILLFSNLWFWLGRRKREIAQQHRQA